MNLGGSPFLCVVAALLLGLCIMALDVLKLQYTLNYSGSGFGECSCVFLQD